MSHRFCTLAIATLFAWFVGIPEAPAFQVNSQTQAAQPMNSGAAQAGNLQQTPVPPPTQPAWAPLAPEMQTYIEQLLLHWEQTSSGVEVYECEFSRWEKDTAYFDLRDVNNELYAHTISSGKIRYSAPDKGMYEVSQKWRVSGPPPEAGAQPPYEIAVDPNGNNETEKWICDGAAIYQFDAQTKRLYETELPAEARGEGLKNSPLPFVFGAKAQDMLDRFWIRDVTPDAAAAEYRYIEVWPKRAQDAQSYQKVEIIFTVSPFLPEGLVMYPPNYDPKTRPATMVFEFKNRVINGGLAQVQNFLGNFVRPATPFGWERIKTPLANDSSQSQSVPSMGQLPQTGNPYPQ